MTDWCPDLSRSNAPRYLAIADTIESDIKSGRLTAGDRLPAQRDLARRLGLDFTTVARGYTEARRRGIISSQVGSGTYVSTTSDIPKDTSTRAPRRQSPPDHSMLLPPEPTDTTLLARMKSGFAALSADLVSLMRYQDLEASEQDKQAGEKWLKDMQLQVSPERIAFAPGAQAALMAILQDLTSPGDLIACEAITYPGIRSLCAQLGLGLIGLQTDGDGIIPDALRSKCQTETLRALYINPTLNNPTTRTIPEARRKELVNIAREFGIPILEDDPYSPLLQIPPKPFTELAPEQTWYIGSLSKSLGAGLRLAYVAAPDKSRAWSLQRALRTASVMPSPMTVALASLWIENGTAKAILDHVRDESAARQSLAGKMLGDFNIATDEAAFHLWLNLPAAWTRSAFVSQIRHLPIGIVESDPFTVSGTPAEAVRICLGGPVDRARLSHALEEIAQTLRSSPQSASAFF